MAGICKACGCQVRLNQWEQERKIEYGTSRDRCWKCIWGGKHEPTPFIIKNRNIGANKKYIKKILSELIKACEAHKKYKPVVYMRASGHTYKEIGERFGFSKQRAEQICKRHCPELCGPEAI